MAAGYFPPNFVAMLLYYYDTNDSYDARISAPLTYLVCLFNVKLFVYQTYENQKYKSYENIKLYSVIYNLYSYVVIIYRIWFLQFTEEYMIIGI